jgi:hypothetical protein
MNKIVGMLILLAILAVSISACTPGVPVDEYSSDTSEEIVQDLSEDLSNGGSGEVSVDDATLDVSGIDTAELEDDGLDVFEEEDDLGDIY